MDPNGSYPNISPLHEALRGTTAMPVLNDFVDLESPSSYSPSIGNSSTNMHAPQEGTVMSVNDSSMIPYQSSAELAPLRPQLGDTIPIPLSSDEKGICKNLSTEASSFTPLLQTEPNSIVHSQLNTNGVLDDGSLFKMATRDVSEKQLKIQDERLSNADPYGVPAPASPAMHSSHILREICNATFNTSQAYGGHMSSHSKARMKNLQS
ncbi:hypothetical protein VPH35_043196 [Triticum aestivum]